MNVLVLVINVLVTGYECINPSYKLMVSGYECINLLVTRYKFVGHWLQIYWSLIMNLSDSDYELFHSKAKSSTVLICINWICGQAVHSRYYEIGLDGFCLILK